MIRKKILIFDEIINFIRIYFAQNASKFGLLGKSILMESDIKSLIQLLEPLKEKLLCFSLYDLYKYNEILRKCFLSLIGRKTLSIIEIWSYHHVNFDLYLAIEYFNICEEISSLHKTYKK